MAEELATITVKLKYSKSGAMAQINAQDFDPEKHARLDEPAPDTASPSTAPPVAPTTDATPGEGEPSTTGRRRP